MLRDIAGGLIIGIALGAVNIFLLRLSVHRALRYHHGWKAVALIFGTYVARYLIIAAVVIALLKLHQVPMAITVLAVLGVMTVLLAVVQQGYKAKSAAGCSGDHAAVEPKL